MNEYEICIETITPCGGEKYAIRQIIEVEAESPEAYVEANKRFPVMDVTTAKDGSVLIITGDGHGNFVRYTFTG